MFDVIIFTVEPDLMQNEFDSLLRLVPSEKQEQIKQFRFSQDARNCLLGNILTRIQICSATGLVNKQLEFSVNAYGKPFLVNRPHIHFNISHAGNYIACAVSDKPVGIDIELINSGNMQIARRFFASDEAEYIENDDHIRRFYEVWTKKESRIKWEGKGLYKSLKSFSIFELNEQEQITYHEVFQNDETICYICSEEQQLPSIRMMDTSSFIQSVMPFLE